MAGFYNPDVIVLLQGTPNCLDWCRRHSPSEDYRRSLFVYRHALSEKFMLARWLTPRGVFLPILEIGDSLAEFDADKADLFLRILYPQREETAAVAMRQAQANERESADNLDETRKELRAKMLRDYCGIKTRHLSGAVFADTCTRGV